MELILLIIFSWGVIGGLVGAAIGSNKNRTGEGFILGLLLGPFGWLFVAFGPDQTPGIICPACKGKVPVGATKCMHCASELPEVDNLQSASESRQLHHGNGSRVSEAREWSCSEQRRRALLHIVKSGHATPTVFEEILSAVGGTVTTNNLVVGQSFLVTLDGSNMWFDNLSDLRDWVLQDLAS